MSPEFCQQLLGFRFSEGEGTKNLKQLGLGELGDRRRVPGWGGAIDVSRVTDRASALDRRARRSVPLGVASRSAGPA